MKKHIDELTLDEINHAVAVAQGWVLRSEIWRNQDLQIDSLWNSQYKPTANKAQCGELIDKYKISKEAIYYCGEFLKWKCYVWKHIVVENENGCVAACKAFLWSVYHDGLIEHE